MRWRGFAVAGVLCLWALAGCAVRETRTDVSPVVHFPDEDGTVALLTEAEPPIHLGDKRGVYKKVPSKLLSDNPAGAYRWTFELKDLPERAFFFMKFDNISHLHVNCATVVRVNGTNVLVLFENPVTPPGYSGPMTRSVAVDHKLLRQGENTLTVLQRPCTSGQRNLRVRNDAVLRAVELQLRYTGPPMSEPSG